VIRVRRSYCSVNWQMASDYHADTFGDSEKTLAGPKWLFLDIVKSKGKMYAAIFTMVHKKGINGEVWKSHNCVAEEWTNRRRRGCIRVRQKRPWIEYMHSRGLPVNG